MTSQTDQETGDVERADAMLPWIDRQIQAAYGSDRPSREIVAALIVMHADGPSRVYLDEEVPGTLMVATNRQDLDPGEMVYVNDIEGLDTFEPPAEFADAAWVLAIRTAHGWAVKMEWLYNAALVSSHLDAAREFMTSSEEALDAGRYRAWAENAFAAAELLAKAELLAFPDDELKNAKRHPAVSSRLHQWAALGNIDPSLPAALSELDNLRAAARYLRAPLQMEHERALALRDAVRRLEQHVLDCASLRAGGRGLRTGVKVKAWRDIEAGAIVQWGVDTGLGKPRQAA